MDNLTTTPRELHGGKAFGYAMGTGGQLLSSAILNAYVLTFYTYTVGLNAILVGIGISIGNIANALMSPLFGLLSDNKRPTKYGKRKTFLLYGLPGLIFCLIAIWMPPMTIQGESTNWSTAIYLWIMEIGFWISYACIRSPYLAMLPEISQVEQNRVKISAIQGLFSIIGALMGILLPLFLQSRLIDPQNPFHTTESGIYLIKNLPIISTIFAIIALSFTLISYFSTDESFYLKSTGILPQKRSIKEGLAQIFGPFKDLQFQKWLICSLFMNIATQMMVVGLTPFLTYVVQLYKSEFLLYMLFLLPFAAGGFLYWQKKAKTMGSRKSFLKSAVFLISSLFSAALFFIQWESSIRRVLAVFVLGFILSTFIVGFILPNPIISALIDQSLTSEPKPQQIQGSKNSGSYFGAYIFMLNIANAISNFIVGLILSGENKTNPMMITLIFPLAAFAYLAALLFFRKIKFVKN